MIYLDSTIMKLQAVMASSTNTTQPQAHVWFYDVPSQQKPGNEEYRGAVKRTALNDTTDVDICAAPAQPNMTRCIKAISILNRSADTEIITVKTDDGTTEGLIVTKSLTTGQAMFYEDGFGWGTF